MSLKKVSTHCIECGVEWLPDLSNKQSRRAICIPCFKKESRESQQVYRVPIEMHRRNRFAEFKQQNRRKHWEKLSKELSNIKDRDEWRELFNIRFNEILSNDLLWEYIRTDHITNEQNRRKQNGTNKNNISR